MITDNAGKIFEDRRKIERRTEQRKKTNNPIELDRRKATRRSADRQK